MKTLKILVLVLALTLSNGLSATTNPDKNVEPETVRETISNLLKNPKIEFKTEMSALVDLALNEKNEIVVLSVGTQNKDFENFIKHRLNYKKISDAIISGQRTFKVPVTVK